MATEHVTVCTGLILTTQVQDAAAQQFCKQILGFLVYTPNPVFTTLVLHANQTKTSSEWLLQTDIPRSL